MLKKVHVQQSLAVAERIRQIGKFGTCIVVECRAHRRCLQLGRADHLSLARQLVSWRSLVVLWVYNSTSPFHHHPLVVIDTKSMAAAPMRTLQADRINTALPQTAPIQKDTKSQERQGVNDPAPIPALAHATDTMSVAGRRSTRAWSTTAPPAHERGENQIVAQERKGRTGMMNSTTTSRDALASRAGAGALRRARPRVPVPDLQLASALHVGTTVCSAVSRALHFTVARALLLVVDTTHRGETKTSSPHRNGAAHTINRLETPHLARMTSTNTLDTVLEVEKVNHAPPRLVVAPLVVLLNARLLHRLSDSLLTPRSTSRTSETTLQRTTAILILLQSPPIHIHPRFHFPLSILINTLSSTTLSIVHKTELNVILVDLLCATCITMRLRNFWNSLLRKMR